MVHNTTVSTKFVFLTPRQ